MGIDRILEFVRTAPRSALRLALGVLTAALLTTAPGFSVGQIVAFDHLTTGWPLTGMHENVRCETCHIKGIFKGTPRTCSYCHSQNDSSRGAKAMPVHHIVTTQTCDTCHSTSTFLGVQFSHVMVVPGTCNTCHDGIHSIGKPPGHIVTLKSCDFCHNMATFALGMPINHIPSPASTPCQTCHDSAPTTYVGGVMNHVNITSNCGQCHAPAVAQTFFGVQIRSSTGLVPP